MKQNSEAWLLDANVFIEAHKRYYAFDICPGFWDCLSYYHDQGKLMSIDWVKKEIEANEDNLWDWVKNTAPEGFFQSSDEPTTQGFYSEIIEWVSSEDFKNEEKTKFAAGADGWLVAYTKTHDLILVTDEKSNPDIKRRVPIPNVCQQFDVPYINTFAMLREMEITFGLQLPQ
ncbi:DUF4411 family protein [Candidatus Spongiihabitans sp.]|uniref:DUF4411 family protein n=1 Tax=Candidatus Spongiihabitans sp. TaxID=3101308 RepID=UPI003C7E2CA6